MTNITKEKAFEEVVADACQRMLLDTDAGQKLTEFGAKSRDNRSILRDVKKWIAEFMDRMRKIFHNVESDTLAAKEFNRFDQKTKQDLADMFVDMSIDAGEKLSIIKAAGMTEKITTEDGGVKRKMGMTDADIKAVQNIGRISVNQFSTADIKATERFAQQYWEEMGVKSPFFRAWFGDWRANDQTKVQVAAQRGNGRGVQKNADTGWDIQVSGKVFDETKRHTESYNIAAKKYIPYINSIVKNAVLLDSFGIDPQKPKSHNSLLMHSLYAVADIGKGPELLKLYVEEMNDPNKEDTSKRAYQLQNVEKYQLQNGSSPQKASSISSATGNIRTVADLFAAVKQKDSSFQPKPVNNYFVNDDGSPKVFYHGTNATWTQYDLTKNVNQAWGEGIYLAPDPKRAALYGDNVMPLYVKADTDNRTAKRTGKQRDYMVMKNGDVLVYSPNQIKSAKDNIGTFDGGNPDIRYKLPGSRDVADRGKLVDLFEQMVTNSSEYRALENYRKHINEMLALEEQVDRLGAEIRKISFAEGPKDMEYLKKLKLLRQKAINRLNNYDNILLRLEKSGVLKGLIERYRKQITQESFDRAKSYYKERNERRENEIRQYYRESRRQAVERHDMAEIRQRIRKDVQRLDSLLGFCLFININYFAISTGNLD